MSLSFGVVCGWMRSWSLPACSSACSRTLSVSVGIFLVQLLDVALHLLLFGDELHEAIAEGVLRLLELRQLLIGGIGVGGDAEDVFARAGRLALAVLRLDQRSAAPRPA